ncbi:MAG: spermidine synthase [Eggerthellaceae bacterium]|jgi:spermidine synthase
MTQGDRMQYLKRLFSRRPRISERQLLASPQTMFGSALVYDQTDENGDRVRVLSINGLKESASYIDERWNELVFDYTERYNLMFASGIPLQRVLMIGGGGYSYPKYLITHRSEITLDVVEIDPAITELAREFFFLDRLEDEFGAESSGRLRIICADGRTYLEEQARKGQAARYEAVLNDSFAAGVPAPSLTTMEAAQAVKGCLVPSGLYLVNVVASLEGRSARFLQAQMRTLAQVFAHVHVVPVSDFGIGFVPDNLMVIATDGPYRFPGETSVAIPDDAPVLTDAENPVEDLVDWV